MCGAGWKVRYWRRHPPRLFTRLEGPLDYGTAFGDLLRFGWEARTLRELFEGGTYENSAVLEPPPLLPLLLVLLPLLPLLLLLLVIELESSESSS